MFKPNEWSRAEPVPTVAGHRRWLRRMLAIISLTLAFALGALVFLAASLAAALVVDSPATFIAVGAVVSFLVMLAVSHLALRHLGLGRRWLPALATSAVATLALLVGFDILFLTPLIPKEEQFVRDIPSDVELWDLHTGSVVAVRKVAATGVRRTHPIVFLHGGPGGYSVSLRPTVEVISRLSTDGYDVYFYDQIGGGLSARLSDISEYTIDRHRADLEAIYKRIGANKVILIGSSWGASLGANYMAKHPGHVVAAVFSGAGPIYHPHWRDVGDGGLDEQLTPTQRTAFSAMVETPRLLAALILADINPKAAAKFAGEQELGSLFDKVANEFYLPVSVCDLEGIKAASSGYGFWSNRMTAKTLQNRTDDPRPALGDNHTPVLILRGECDYKREAVAREYAAVFPNAQLSILSDVGHMLYWEKPDAYLRRVRQFLTRVVVD